MIEKAVEILKNASVIAVVGLSRNPYKDSHIVARYLLSQGYEVIPINPNSQEILGIKSYPSLSDLPPELKRRVDIVDIFVPQRLIGKIVDDAIEMRRKYGKPDLIWMQEGLIDFEAMQKAESEGILVIMDKCIMKLHMALIAH